jgi:RNA polymerase sigma-70 factor, ECF subfamily
MDTTRQDNDNVIIDDAIRRIRADDQSAFEVIIRRYERPLRAWLAAQAPPGIDIDEIAQRSFVTVYTKLDSYQLGTDFGAWLFTVARFQLKTETTRVRRIADYHTRYGMDLLANEQARRAEEPPRLQLDRLEHLRHCVDDLGDHVRRFIDWRYDERIPLEVMAERSGRSIPAMKKQLWKLRRKLHDCIQAKMMAEGAR